MPNPLDLITENDFVGGGARLHARSFAFGKLPAFSSVSLLQGDLWAEKAQTSAGVHRGPVTPGPVQLLERNLRSGNQYGRRSGDLKE